MSEYWRVATDTTIAVATAAVTFSLLARLPIIQPPSAKLILAQDAI